MRLRILHLEDNPYDQELTIEKLKTHGLECDFLVAGTRAEFERALEQQNFDVILSDFTLPGFGGLEALRMVQERQLAVPFIFVSGTIGEESAVESLKLGATDWVLKDRLDRLPSILERAMRDSQRLRAQQAAEQAIVDERNLLRTLIDSLPDLVFVKDSEARFKVMNAAYLQFLGLETEHQVLGKTVPELISHSIADARHQEDLGVLESGNPVFNREEIYFDPEENLHATLVTKVPLLNSDGKVTGLVGVLRDITQRKRDEMHVAAFAMLGKKLSEAQSAKEAARVVLETAVSLFRCNQCAFDLFSPAADKMVRVLSYRIENGKPVEYCAEDGEASPWSPVSSLPAGDPDLSHRRAAESPDDSAVDLSTIKVPIQTGTNVIGFVSIQSGRPRAFGKHELEVLQALADHCAGTLERIRSQETEAEALDFLQKAQEVAHIGSWSLELGPKPKLCWSSEVFRIFGVPEHEFRGTRAEFHQRVHPDDLKLVQQSSEAALHHGAEYDFDHRIVLPDGTVRWVHEKGKVIRNAQGEPVKMIGVVQDITERKELEAQLRQAQKMEAVGQLAGGIAHDFNNLLAVITGNAELALMREAQIPQSLRDSLNEVMAAAERAAGLTRQMLAFSRQQVVQRQPVKIDEVVTNLTKMLRRVIDENIALECVRSADLPFIEGDVNMIEQVVVNLVVNARDAMPHGGTIRIRSSKVGVDASQLRGHPDRRVGEFVCLTVEDTGTGIAPEHLGRIFEPFFTTKEVGKGTGLGLATVYGIIKQHHGWVEVSSEPGAGASFKIFLPVLARKVASLSEGHPKAEIRGGTETILLVEDELSLRTIISRVLVGFNYKVCEAGGFTEALEVWQKKSDEITLLLTDVIMPEPGTGAELAQRLRSEKPGLRVVFMSGYSPDEACRRIEASEQGQEWFLQKPFAAAKLLETVRQCLDSSR